MDDRTRSGPVSPYDLLLALVPLALLAGVVGARLVSASSTVGVAAGGLSAALVVGYGLFYRTPVDDTGRPPGAGDRRTGT